MKKLIFLALTILLSSACVLKENTNENSELNTEIDNYVAKIMAIQETPGMAVAVLKDGAVLHKQYYGISSLDSKKEVDGNTVFRLYSLTKLMTSISVFKLIEEGKLTLDTPISSYFNDLPPAWQKVKIVNLLSHSSGLPDVRKLTKELSDEGISDIDFIRLLYNDPMDFKTNELWSYNQTNFLLLKLIIEQLSGATFEEHVLNHQFSAADSKEVLFSSDPFESVPNRAKYYDFDKEKVAFKMKPEFPGTRSHPLNGINITLNEYIAWNKKLDNDLLINADSKNKMWTAFDFKESDRAFLNGWDVYDVNGYKSFGFSGGGVSGYRKFVDKNLTVIVLMNGYKYYSVQDQMIDYIAGLLDESLKNEGALLTEQILNQYYLKSTTLTTSEIVEKIKSENQSLNLEEPFKSVGYQLFFQLDKKEEAIALFKLNVLEYPDSYDTHGSLGYLYFLTNQFKESRKNYEKALELNPENSYSERRMKQIDEILNKNANNNE